MSTTAVIREKLIMQYDQLYNIAKNKVDALAALSVPVTKTVTEILDSFIEDAAALHTAPFWTSDYYDRGVILKTGHLLTLSQARAKNSGFIVREKTGTGDSASETEYIRPSLNNFGKNATTDFGQQWEVLRDEAKEAYFPEDYCFYINGG